VVAAPEPVLHWGMDELTTDRLVVRPYTLDDADAAFDVYRHWEVTRWLGSVPTPVESVEQMRDGIGRWIDRDDPDRPYLGIRAVTLRATGTLVGTALLVPLPRSGADLEIGWHLHPDHWGHGYATEAARAQMAAAFAGGVPELLAVVRPGNTASVAVTRRLGMEPLGRTTKYYETELDLFRRAAPAPG
jgi:RimJ/RimL family protein N-acetyltransferase